MILFGIDTILIDFINYTLRNCVSLQRKKYKKKKKTLIRCVKINRKKNEAIECEREKPEMEAHSNYHML